MIVSTRVLDASNNDINTVINHLATSGIFQFIPGGQNLNGEIGLKVIPIAAPPVDAGLTFAPTILLATTASSIPANVLGYSFSVLSGTVTLGGVTIPVGTTITGGGYAGYKMSGALAYDASAGSALINYDLPV